MQECQALREAQEAAAQQQAAVAAEAAQALAAVRAELEAAQAACAGGSPSGSCCLMLSIFGMQTMGVPRAPSLLSVLHWEGWWAPCWYRLQFEQETHAAAASMSVQNVRGRRECRGPQPDEGGRSRPGSCHGGAAARTSPQCAACSGAARHLGQAYQLAVMVLH